MGGCRPHGGRGCRPSRRGRFHRPVAASNGGPPGRQVGPYGEGRGHHAGRKPAACPARGPISGQLAHFVPFAHAAGPKSWHPAIFPPRRSRHLARCHPPCVGADFIGPLPRATGTRRADKSAPTMGGCSPMKGGGAARTAGDGAVRTAGDGAARQLSECGEACLTLEQQLLGRVYG